MEIKTLKRLLELRFDNNASIYMDESLYSTLYEITREGNNITLYFDNKKKYATDPKESQWIDTTDLTEFVSFNGIYYDPEKITYTGHASHWLSPIHIVFLIIRESNEKTK